MPETKSKSPWVAVHKDGANGDNTYRMAVPGGWLFMVRTWSDKGTAVALTFVPKPPDYKPPPKKPAPDPDAVPPK